MIDPDYPDQNKNDQTFFFYDLETSGFSPREDRIMQFAGMRTDLDFNQIGEPVNILIKMSDDTLPSPSAIMVTKITPQQTQMDGISEPEFCKYVMNEIFTPGTIEMGYNSVRFDDEFMRFMLYRNFYDPYEWQWKDNRSRWDLLDVVRLTRALRPEGICWPVCDRTRTDENGDVHKFLFPTNRLELLTKMNHIEHENAHDALADVNALISVTKLIREKQPGLYKYLFKMRDQKEVKTLVNLDHKIPFVYACGRYDAKYNNTTVALPFAPSRNGNVLVFDLRYNLDELLEQEKNYKSEQKKRHDGVLYQSVWNWYPIVKEIGFNKCPAVSPLSVLDSKSTENSNDEAAPFEAGASGWDKLGLSKEQITKNMNSVLSHPEFARRMSREKSEKINEFAMREEEASKDEAEKDGISYVPDAESKLYDSFMPASDKPALEMIKEKAKARDAENELADFHPKFADERLDELLLHYKARNFRKSLDEKEEEMWNKYRENRLKKQEKNFVAEISELNELAKKGQMTKNGKPIDESVLQDLMLWYQSLGSDDYE